MKWLSSLFAGSKMAGSKTGALPAGTQASQFELPAMDGSSFSLSEALSRGPVLAVFFKISCPVCQYALPYFQRIYQAYGRDNVTIEGISQNEKQDTALFMKKYGVTFPVLLDDLKTFPASNAYGLTNVPTTFWISEDGVIEISSVGWMRKEFEEIVRKAALAASKTFTPVFQPAEQIADFRAG